MQLPPETCAECGREISRRARANVIDDRVVCTACWRRLDAARQERARWDGPASARQTGYAADLGLRFPPDGTWGQLHDILSRHLDYDGQDYDAPPWVAAHARSLGVPVSRFSGAHQLFDATFGALAAEGDGQLAHWFAYNVAREVWADAPEEVVREVADGLAADPALMKSVRRYGGSALLDFGMATDADGSVRTGGSNRTLAYKAAAELLRQCRDRGW